MVPLTRRRALQGAAALLAGLAGCSDATGGFSSTATMSSDWRPRNALSDPELRTLRRDGTEPVVRTGDGASTDEPDRRHYPTYGFVASEDDRDALRLADVDGVDEVERFLDGVDFDSETIHYVQAKVRECYRRELCYVAWSSDRVQTRFAWHLRGAQEACEADAHVIVAWFVKIPEAIDPDDITRYGTGGSRGCRLPDRVANTSREGDDATAAADATDTAGETDTADTADIADATDTATDTPHAATGTEGSE